MLTHDGPIVVSHRLITRRMEALQIVQKLLSTEQGHTIIGFLKEKKNGLNIIN